ncbi:MAG TPA: FtsW/RodA/SpoVE family cell cycle protein, partial [Bryobacteraceae bacterium]|nr:FtsW/RodA/SpoVE family cell cycle protein [Bryobacteraceae bacterium]
MAQRLKTDWILFVTVLAMMSFGILILYSASSIMAQLDPRYGWSWHFVVRQVEWAAVAVAVMMTLKKTHYQKFQNRTVAFCAMSVALMLLGAVYFLDTAHHRWLRVGSFGVQPSELAKPALVIFLAFFVTWRARAINNPRYTLIPAALAVGLIILAVVVADLGTAVVLGAAVAAVFIIAGLEWRYCLIAAAVAAVGVAIFILAEPYRIVRVVQFFDPEFKIIARFDPHGKIRSRMEQSLVTRDTNYQLEQSQIAVGAGG